MRELTVPTSYGIVLGRLPYVTFRVSHTSVVRNHDSILGLSQSSPHTDTARLLSTGVPRSTLQSLSELLWLAIATTCWEKSFYLLPLSLCLPARQQRPWQGEVLANNAELLSGAVPHARLLVAGTEERLRDGVRTSFDGLRYGYGNLTVLVSSWVAGSQVQLLK